MRTHPHQRPLLGVLAQVERGEHAERRDREAHQEDHHHGAEDGREDAALGVRLARVVGQELPDPGDVELASCRRSPWRSAARRARSRRPRLLRRARRRSSITSCLLVEQRPAARRARRRARRSGLAARLRPPAISACRRAALSSAGPAGPRRSSRRSARRSCSMLVVDVADLVLEVLDPLPRSAAFASRSGPRAPPRSRRARRRGSRRRAPDRAREAVEVAPLQALEEHRARRVAGARRRSGSSTQTKSTPSTSRLPTLRRMRVPVEPAARRPTGIVLALLDLAQQARGRRRAQQVDGLVCQK